jgi:ribosomal protein S3AE
MTQEICVQVKAKQANRTFPLKQIHVAKTRKTKETHTKIAALEAQHKLWLRT